MKLFSTLLLLSLGIFAQAQYISGITIPDTSTAIISDTNDVRVKFANTITQEELKAHLSILASDEFEGRETGEKGNELAAKYLSDQYAKMDLPKIGDDNSYYQKVAFTWTMWNNTEIYVNEQRYKHLWDYLAFPSKSENLPEWKTDEVVFMGYGIDDEKYSDYGKRDLEGKTILIFSGEPVSKDSTYYITGTNTPSKWSASAEEKLMVAKKKGVKLVLVIEPNIKKVLGENRRFLLGPQLELGDKPADVSHLANHAYISSTVAQAIWGKKEKKVIKARNKANKKGKFKPVTLKTGFSIALDKKVNTIHGNNVMGFIEGSDLKDQVVVVSSHFDHLGKRGDDIYNGADDNGSGTSACLEIAEAFQKAKLNGHGPRRSVLFLHVTGEEKGLLGSAYYAENPVYPLENTVADVNVDMIGRVDEKNQEDPNYIYVIGSDRLSSELHVINEQVNQAYSQLKLDYTYNSEEDPNRYYYRSDHYNFAEKGIPAIFYFSGVHEDYHRTTDTVDKIMFEKMEKITRHIFQTTWQLANQDKRIEVDVK